MLYLSGLKIPVKEFCNKIQKHGQQTARIHFLTDVFALGWLLLGYAETDLKFVHTAPNQSQLPPEHS